MTYVGGVGSWLACRTCHQGQLGGTSPGARTTNSLRPGRREQQGLFGLRWQHCQEQHSHFFWSHFLSQKQTPSLPSIFARRTPAKGITCWKYWAWTPYTYSWLFKLTNVGHLTRSEKEVLKARQFSPDPVINVGFLAFMAAMGLDLVYKVTRTLSYFEESE